MARCSNRWMAELEPELYALVRHTPSPADQRTAMLAALAEARDADPELRATQDRRHAAAIHRMWRAVGRGDYVAAGVWDRYAERLELLRRY